MAANDQIECRSTELSLSNDTVIHNRKGWQERERERQEEGREERGRKGEGKERDRKEERKKKEKRKKGFSKPNIASKL